MLNAEKVTIQSSYIKENDIIPQHQMCHQSHQQQNKYLDRQVMFLQPEIMENLKSEAIKTEKTCLSACCTHFHVSMRQKENK